MERLYCTLNTRKPSIIIDGATHNVASIKPELPKNRTFEFWGILQGTHFVRGKIGKHIAIIELA